MSSMLNAMLGYAEKPAAKPSGDAGEHLHAAIAAHKKGDHHGAKKHALKAVNMLHRMTGTPQAPDPSAPAPAVPAGA